MNDRKKAGDELSAMESRLREMRTRKKVRWTMSQETAELAIAALAIEAREAQERTRSSKSRRRKRRKRLL